MIFEVSAGQIERLDQGQLVALLRRLIYAELSKNSIPLRSGTAPAQITIPDGGDDARVSWTGGPNETDWLQSRFTVFQCKKGNTSPSGLKEETQTKSSQGSSCPRANEAIEEALSKSGAYLIVTNTPVVGTKIDRRIEAIQEGICETGNDPSLLSSIQIYDCNRLAAWANTHPSVGLWLNTLLRDVYLGGFQTFEDWGRSPEISQIEFQKSDDTRFIAKGTEIKTWRSEDASISQEKSFDEIREVISTFFLARGNAVRVIGPSGYGKTRLVHQLIASQSSLPQDILDKSQVIYCVYEDVKGQILNIAREIVDTRSRAFIIVDDCPDEIHARLNEIVHREGSRCHLMTIGVETKSHGMHQNLIVELNAASNELIGYIAEAINKEVSSRNASLIRDLSQGFPRMAVFASRALEDGDEELSSVEILISRLVWGEREEDQQAFESLQLLSLFTIVGLENDAAHELEEIASYCNKTGQAMYRELSRFTERGVLFRQGDYGEVQPLPLAMRLSNQWLESNPAGTLEILFRSLSEEMKLRMVGRLRWVSWSNKVTSFARALLAEALPDETALDSEFGSKLLDRFVHLAPDATMEHLDSLLASHSIDELAAFDSGRRYTIWALEKLVFRRQTFDPAARLLLKLGAAENENWSNNASGQFIGLFQLYLSGTEAAPADKLLVLDDGLANTDERVRKLCVAALDRMLQSGSFSRTGGSEHIGAGEALEDWEPKTYGEIFDYYRSALRRLEKIALSDDDSNREIALNNIGLHLRGLFSIEPMFDEVKAMVARLREIYPQWNTAAFMVNAWLYFDRNDASYEHRERLRAFYDELIPSDTIEKIYYYSSGWAVDIHDPDVCYSRGGDNDHDYGLKKIHELVDASPNHAVYFFPLVDKFLGGPASSAWIAMLRIAKHINDPDRLLRYVLESLSSDSDIVVLSNLVRNIISGAAEIDRSKGLECLDIALGVKSLSKSSIEFVAAVGLDDALMQRAVEFVKNDTAEPHQVSELVFNEFLQRIDHALIEVLISALQTKGEQGAWAAIEFLGRVLYRSNPKEGWLLESLAQSVINPALFDKERYSNMDWYLWRVLVEKLLDSGRIDDGFKAQLVDFIISVTTVEEFGVQLAFDDHAQEILHHLIYSSPSLVWEKYHEMREASDIRARYRLESLFGSSSGSPSEPGVLNSIPKDIYIPWMLEDKEGRMSFVLGWIRLFIKVDDNERSWDPCFVEFLDSHVDRPDRLDVLCARLTTGSWVGSYANKLESERDQLLQLRGVSKNTYVHRWVDQVVSRIGQKIIEEQRKDGNREAHYRA
ncbi:hypothetical protein [Halomonas elongata]|uniref:hypothetical protein n=1 Tax=Halomonas elongata TaxID=2746 RepID=UPI00403323B5